MAGFRMARIQWVGFDGDDTLWKSEDYYRQAEADFEAILATYIDLADPRTHGHLLEVERKRLGRTQQYGRLDRGHVRLRGPGPRPGWTGR